MIYVECKADEALVRTLTGLPRREVIHELKGKPEVVNQVRSRSNTRGLVDEDPQQLQPPYLERMRIVQYMPERGLRVLGDGARGNHLVVLCPRLEEWIVRAAREAGVDLGRYGLPNNPLELHKVINVNLTRFGGLVAALLSVAQLAKHIITHFTPILAFPLKGEGISSLPLKGES